MNLPARVRQPAINHPAWPSLGPVLLLLLCWVTSGYGMTDETISSLIQDTRDLFYHGWTNYLAHGFPEDEVKPISCQPQVRNRDNPADIGLNDVLGNYSLTLIDSLSTLAILASGDEDGSDGHFALRDFQWGVKALVELYGDGSVDDAGRCGTRACGFDLDSKVQVFETNIRGVGGLLSAHLFASGELPIRGYQPQWENHKEGVRGIKWSNGFVYTTQLLDLARDLATRLLPAFSTQTGLPYPRVNLRHGIPFYQDAEAGVCRLDGTSTDPREITENCAAGAGSLVLEFTVLSRLTGDQQFEQLAKEAFWSVWERRSSIGLVGNGIDAESGHWTMPPLAGIGAGIDSFFEYAMKSHILLSADHDGDSQAFLSVWQQAHESIRHHVRRSALAEKHPYYGQVDLVTGAPRYSWIDNLSAYYPGLLTLAGELDEAIESHLLFSALWTRYSALPERWHAPAAHVTSGDGFIDPNFKHWAGRPEFVESTYYLYQATRDPWYLHVGEMVLRDIRRRCWAKCGWADLGDVISGEQRDRMESFFLGETAKYLFLLFESARGGHELQKTDGQTVFTTEGHPLVIPKSARKLHARRDGRVEAEAEDDERSPIADIPAPTCPIPPPSLPLTVSNVANRADFFHAAALAQLHLVPINPARASPLLRSSSKSPGISYADVRSPSNYTFYPWTLPEYLIPSNGMSSPITTPIISTLTFPNLNPPNGQDGGAATASDGSPLIALGALQKVLNGILINSLSNLRLSMVQIPRHSDFATRESVAIKGGAKGPAYEFKINSIGNWALGQDEKVLLNSEAIKGVSPTDPHFTRVKDLERIDLVIDVPTSSSASSDGREDEMEVELDVNAALEGFYESLEAMLKGFMNGGEEQAEDVDIDITTVGNLTSTPNSSSKPPTQTQLIRQALPAMLPTGIGAAPLTAEMDNTDPLPLALGSLPHQKIYFLDSTLCTQSLPSWIAKSHTVLVILRGGCSFNDKLANIPTFPPELRTSLELVIVISNPEDTSEDHLIRPLLDQVQRTKSGLERRHPLAMCLVDGSGETFEALRAVASGVGGWDGKGEFVEVRRGEEGMGGGGGMAVRRRYWFESMGVVIANLILV